MCKTQAISSTTNIRYLDVIVKRLALKIYAKTEEMKE